MGPRRRSSRSRPVDEAHAGIVTGAAGFRVPWVLAMNSGNNLNMADL